MRDVLCIYYSRTGNTKRVMETIAKEMDAELLALTDGVERSGLRGWLRSGMDAMLVEAGFITNAAELALLRSEDGQQMLAECIAQGILSQLQAQNTEE